MKKCLFVTSMFLAINLIGGVVYADDITSNNINNVSSSSSISSDNIIKSTSNTNKSYEVRTTEQKTTIGQSNFNIVVSNDDMFTNLDTFVDNYTFPGMSAETKQLLLKSLTSLVISVITGDSSYTIDTFKSAFVDICVSYGIDITDDFLQSLDKYTSKYLDDEFEQVEEENLLVWIGGTVGLMTTLFITSQLGGVHRA